MNWQVVVESEGGVRKSSGPWSDDLREVTATALTLADDLGRRAIESRATSTVHIISDAGTVELSIKALLGGL